MSFYDELMRDFRKMLNFRNSVGYATATYISSVTPFIEYCGTHYPEADCLAKEMVDGWLRYYPYKTDNTRSAFVSLLRQYAKFINALGKKGFIPDEDYTIPRQPYVPYVFTDGELLTLFDAIDSIPRCRVKKFRRDLVLPAMFRMMYCCGMRPSEPLHLRSKDVDLVTGDSIYDSPKDIRTGILFFRMTCVYFAIPITHCPKVAIGSSKEVTGNHTRRTG